MNIHYDVTTGDIICYGNAEYEDGADSYLAGCKVLMISNGDIDARRQRVDLNTLTLIDRDDVQDHPAMTALNILTQGS